MKELVASLTRDGKTTKSLDLGDWDISNGLDTTIYLTNPNNYARADLSGVKNSDPRLKLEMPSEIKAGEKNVEIKVKIAAVDFDNPMEEERFFKDILDKLSGRVVWRTP